MGSIQGPSVRTSAMAMAMGMAMANSAGVPRPPQRPGDLRCRSGGAAKSASQLPAKLLSCAALSALADTMYGLAYVLFPKQFASLQAELDRTLAPFMRGSEQDFPREKLAFYDATDALTRLH